MQDDFLRCVTDALIGVGVTARGELEIAGQLAFCMETFNDFLCGLRILFDNYE